MSILKKNPSGLLGIMVIGVVMGLIFLSVPVNAGEKSEATGGLFQAAEPTARMLEREAEDDNYKPWLVRSRRVSVNFQPLCQARDRLAAGDGLPMLTLNLFDDVIIKARIYRTEQTFNGGTALIGDIESIPFSSVVIVTSGDMVMANISAPGQNYQVRYEAEQVHQVIEISQGQFPNELPPIPVYINHREASPAVPTSGDSADTIDVLVVYTAQARTSVGSVGAMETLIALAVTETNTGYSNSGVTQRIRLVHMEEVVYSEESFNWSTTLSRLSGTTDGYMDNVHTLRDTYSADEVVLIVDNSAYCGIGYVMQTVSSSFASAAFCVVSNDCATGYYSLAHEMGHNMGCAHDRANASVIGAYTYAYGYQAPDESFRTIMAYNCAGGCTRVNYWSNPDINYGGQPMGVIYTDAAAADNRRALNNTAATVANFRQSIVSPVITVTSPNGGESWLAGESRSITWTSSGGVGDVKIEYSTNNGGVWTTIIAQTSNDGSHSWTIPQVDSSQCLVRISEAVDNNPTDNSNTVFTINTPSLDVTSPDGGEKWVAGTTHAITWTSQDITGNITIQLYNTGGYVQNISTQPVTAGSYNWTIPVAMTPGTDYSIRIVQGSWENFSSNDFSIFSAHRGADFNNDGHTDFLLRYYATDGGWNMIWTMNGINKVSTYNLPRIPDVNWRINGVGDFNNDGHMDILWRYYGVNGGWNMIWLMNGTSRSSIVNLPQVPDINWEIAGTGDFNNDGKTDILWRYYGANGGWNMVWYMNGTTRTSSVNLSRVPDVNWRIDGTGDFNNDGKMDILWRYYAVNGGWNMIWYMNGITNTSSSNPQRVTDVNWKIEGTGDFNRDGKTDILWRYYAPNGGWNMVWYMNDMNKTGSVNPLRIEDINWKIDN